MALSLGGGELVARRGNVKNSTHASACARGQPSPGRTHARALALSLCTPGATKISHIASQRQSTHAAPLSSTSDTRRSRVVVKARLECSAQARTIRGTERESSVDVADPIHPDDVSRSAKKKRGKIYHFFLRFLIYHPTQPRRKKKTSAEEKKKILRS